MVDVEEMLTDLRLESSVRVLVHAVSVTVSVDFFMANFSYIAPTLYRSVYSPERSWTM